MQVIEDLLARVRLLEVPGAQGERIHITLTVGVYTRVPAARRRAARSRIAGPGTAGMRAAGVPLRAE